MKSKISLISTWRDVTLFGCQSIWIFYFICCYFHYIFSFLSFLFLSIVFSALSVWCVNFLGWHSWINHSQHLSLFGWKQKGPKTNPNGSVLGSSQLTSKFLWDPFSLIPLSFSFFLIELIMTLGPTISTHTLPTFHCPFRSSSSVGPFFQLSLVYHHLVPSKLVVDMKDEMRTKIK